MTADPSPIQVGAYTAGIIAYNEGRPSTSVPFLNADPQVADLRLLWIRGWVHARTAHLYGDYPELTDPAVIRLRSIGRTSTLTPPAAP